MDAAQAGQVTRSAADIYEEFFVPALFQEWAAPVAEAAEISPGNAVLDVGCGTGVLAREAFARTRPDGAVIGVDRNEGMLAVAKRACPGVDWRQGRAEALAFEAGRFDAVVSQFGLMFFDDRVAALREMLRVLRPGGRLAVAVWDTLERTPGYAAMTALLRRLFGDEAAAALTAPFVLGDQQTLLAIFTEAGIADARVSTRTGEAHFPSIDAWVHTDVRGWTLADMIDADQYEVLRRAARTELAQYTRPGGEVRFASPAHIVTFAKP